MVEVIQELCRELKEEFKSYSFDLKFSSIEFEGFFLRASPCFEKIHFTTEADPCRGGECEEIATISPFSVVFEAKDFFKKTLFESIGETEGEVFFEDIEKILNFTKGLLFKKRNEKNAAFNSVNPQAALRIKFEDHCANARRPLFFARGSVEEARYFSWILGQRDCCPYCLSIASKLDFVEGGEELVLKDEICKFEKDALYKKIFFKGKSYENCILIDGMFFQKRKAGPEFICEKQDSSLFLLGSIAKTTFLKFMRVVCAQNSEE